MARFILELTITGEETKDFNKDLCGLLAYAHLCAKRGDFAAQGLGEPKQLITTDSGKLRLARKE